MRRLGHVLRQHRHHAPRMHGIAQDPFPRVLRHHKLGKLEHRKLRSLVRAPARPQAQRAHAADIDDRFHAPRGTEEQGQEGPRHPVQPAVVDLPRLPVVVRVGVRDRDPRFQITRVVDQDIELPKRFSRLPRRGLHARVVQHVKLEHQELRRCALGC